MSETIYGEEIFFDFIEVPASELATAGELVRKVKNRELDGFVTRNVFTKEEVEAIKETMIGLDENEFFKTPSGRVFPAPFATITDTGERLDSYYKHLAVLDSLKANPVVSNTLTKLDNFFKQVGADFKVSIPINKIKDKPVAPGTFRFFLKNMGGLHVHCGNLFQAQSMFYYSLIKNDIDMDDQLSYFLVLQNSEEGGELTIYDMLWKDVKRKESPEENDFVIADDDRKIYLTDVKSFAVKPQPGDILIFAGGPIWHRVENIKGNRPRITLGGFINFSKDGTELFYWS